MRIMLPFGDEPDFTVRAVELVGDKSPPWVPYHWMGGLLEELQVESVCTPDVSPISIWGHIDSAACMQPLEQIAIRVTVILLCSAPLLWVVVYRRTLQRVLRTLGLRLEANELNERLDALGTALLIPGMVYYLGLLSHEQFSLVISLLISVVWGNWLLLLGLAAYTMVLDLGNGAIVFAFLAIYLGIAIIWRFSGLKGLGIFVICTVGYVFFDGYELLNYVQAIPLLLDKADAIYTKSLAAEFLEKYPIILRPIITYMTSVFMTPAGIKAVPVQLVFSVAIVVGLRRLRISLRRTTTVSQEEGTVPQRPREMDAERLLPMIAALMTIIVFGLMLPDYANAKYYIFLAPFFVRPFVVVFNHRSRLLFMNACCTLVLIMLAFQYI